MNGEIALALERREMPNRRENQATNDGFHGKAVNFQGIKTKSKSHCQRRKSGFHGQQRKALEFGVPKRARFHERSRKTDKAKRAERPESPGTALKFQSIFISLFFGESCDGGQGIPGRFSAFGQ
jgi:hypothetical protein